MLFRKNDFLAFTLSHPEMASENSVSGSSFDAFLEDTGILRLEPKKPASVSLVLSVGVHGNETGPIELVNSIVESILSNELALGVRLLVLIGNPVAANAATRFVDVNMNRLFNGAWKKESCPEATRAARLERAVAEFFAQSPDDGALRLHYDLHTAIRGSAFEKFAVYPFLHGGCYSKEQLSFLAASGIEAVLLSHQPTTTFSYASSVLHGAHAFTVELGKVYPFGENDLTRFDAIHGSLRHLIRTGELPQGNEASVSLFEVCDVLVKDAEDYELHIAENEKNFTAFDADYLLASSSLSSYRVQQDGDAIVFPNVKLPVGQRAGLVVRPKQLSDLVVS